MNVIFKLIINIFEFRLLISLKYKLNIYIIFAKNKIFLY